MNGPLATPFCLLAIYFGMWGGDTPSRILNIRFTSDHIAIDGAIGNDDSIVIVLDTFNDKNNAYVFAVNSLNTQFDARIFENGGSWDPEWNGGSEAACTIGGGDPQDRIEENHRTSRGVYRLGRCGKLL